MPCQSTLPLAVLAASMLLASPVHAAYSSVVAVGSIQPALGCADGAMDCAATQLELRDGLWRKALASLPSGTFTYRIAALDAATTTFGQNGVIDGTPIALTLPVAGPVKLYFEPSEHAILDTQNNVIAVAVGSFQSELGCPGDWQPDCLRSLVFDPDGDGRYERRLAGLPAGTYDAKVALNESWTESYGAGGSPTGTNISFAGPPDPSVPVYARFIAATHLLTFETRALSRCALAPLGEPVAGSPFPWKLIVSATYGTATGIVRTYVDDVDGGTAALGVDGSASSSAVIATPGTHVLRVAYAGDEGIDECSAEATVTVKASAVAEPDAGSDAGPPQPDASIPDPVTDAGVVPEQETAPAPMSAGGEGCAAAAGNASPLGLAGMLAALAAVRRRRR